ncbi:unnamed protein product, partial [Brassica oleracea]
LVTFSNCSFLQKTLAAASAIDLNISSEVNFVINSSHVFSYRWRFFSDCVYFYDKEDEHTCIYPSESNCYRWVSEFQSS